MKVTVFDTTLRDGEQAPGFHMSAAEKREVAIQLARLRVDVIEAGFPASSPAEFEAVRGVAGTVGAIPGAPEVCALARCVDADVDAAIAAVAPAARGRVHVFIATSDVHARHKLRMSRAEILERIRTSVERAARSGRNVQFSAEDASRTDASFLDQAVGVALAAGARTINIPDTVGYALPDEFGGTVRRVSDRAARAGAAVSVHCHDDLGMAVANAMSGLRAGARQVEATINGIGERAGNCALEEIVMAIRVRGGSAGLDTGIDARELAAASRLVARVTGHAVPANKAIVGANAFAHGSGIHQDGMLKNAGTYEIMRPEDVGAGRSRLVLTARSGRSAVRARLAESGVVLDDGKLERIYAAFKEAAEGGKVVEDAALMSFVAGWTADGGITGGSRETSCPQ